MIWVIRSAKVSGVTLSMVMPAVSNLWKDSGSTRIRADFTAEDGKGSLGNCLANSFMSFVNAVILLLDSEICTGRFVS